jgi:hypothetical protein
MDETVVNSIGHRKSGRFQFVFQLPEVIFGLNTKGDMVKDKGPSDRPTMLFFGHGLYPGPFKKGNQVGIRNLKKVMAVTGLTQPRHESHAQQIPPETDCPVHIPGGHSQVVHPIEPNHILASVFTLSQVASSDCASKWSTLGIPIPG